MDNILYFAQKGTTFKVRDAAERSIFSVGIRKAKIRWAELAKTQTGTIEYKGNGQKKVVAEKTAQVRAEINAFIKLYKPKIIVTDCLIAIGHMTGNTSVDSCVGSVYLYDYEDQKIPVICTLPVVRTFSSARDRWVFLNTAVKIRRWFEGSIRHQPKFRFTVCYTVEDVKAAVNYLQDCVLVSEDIETAGTFISCIGYSGLSKSGAIQCFVIPFYNPRATDNAHWPMEQEEVEVWQLIRKFHSTEVYKTMHNGSYDSTYFIKYNTPPKFWLFDSLHMFHSLWVEAEKSLGKVSAICLDWVQYWKDDIKGDTAEKEAANKDKARVPTSEAGLMNYWRYNALDCYYTLLNTVRLATFMQMEQFEYGRRNFVVEFLLQIGPYMFMSMMGMPLNQKRRKIKRAEWQKTADKLRNELQIMVDDPEFNHKSPKQVASLVYDVLGATPIKKRGRLTAKQKAAQERATGEKILKLIARQHPLFKLYIDKILATKKPENLISKYGYMKTLASRFLYKISAAATTTNRSSSKASDFWVGTNAQNLPKHARDIIVAEDGHVILDIDFSQSDSYGVAFECEDPLMIHNVMSPQDTHLIHAEFFFQQPYAELYASYKAGDPDAALIRKLTKPIVHGANYSMSGGTFYVQTGHDQVVAIAQALGHKSAHTWEQKRLESFSDGQLKRYKELYVKLPKWIEKEIETVSNNGNRATAFFGFTRQFFGNLRKDAALQRELAAHYGQGFTAGNMNRTMLHYHYKTDLRQKGACLRLQVHDSLVFMIPEDKLSLCKDVKAIMEAEIEIKGRKFSVPAEGEIGYTWGAGLVEYDLNLTAEQQLERAREREEEIEELYRDKQYLIA